MDFFEPPPPPPPEPEEYVPPPWFQSPEDVFAALVPDRRVLAREGPVVVMLSHIDVYPAGCQLYVRVVARRSDEIDDDEWWSLHELVMGPRMGRHRRERSLPDTLLRLGVEFPDGRRATTTGWPHLPHSHDPQQPPPDGPILMEHGGGGGGSDRQVGTNRPLWLWPLPPAEPFDLVLEWPAAGIPLTRVEVDGAAINEAAQRCRPLFEADPA